VYDQHGIRSLHSVELTVYERVPTKKATAGIVNLG